MKTVQDTSIPPSEYRALPIGQLAESSTNPRKRFDEASLKELAESIEQQGLLAPLLVRPLSEERFEIVAGSRRFRAARLAGLSHVPVRVVELNEAEATLAQVTENLQRENIHPLEEAQGFRALLNLPEHPFTIPLIAAKLGKNPQYVASRLKLTDVIAPVAEAFLADKITAGHALLLAKLPPAQQAEALKACFKTNWGPGSPSEVLVTVKELAGWIELNVLLDLMSAPFDRADSTLVPVAGSCHECAKRTGANALLFPESGTDQCLDRACYQGKIEAHIARATAQNPELVRISTNWSSSPNGVLGRAKYVQIVPKTSRNGKLTPEQQTCPHTRQAIVVEGGQTGQVLNICADSECPAHQAQAQKYRREEERLRAERCEQNERRKQDLATRNRLLGVILGKVTAPLAKADLEFLTRAAADRLPQETRMLLIQRHSPKDQQKKTGKPPVDPGAFFKDLDETGYSRLLMEMALLDAACNSYARDGAKQLESIAKRYHIPVQKVSNAVAAEFAARRKKERERKHAKARPKPNQAHA